MIFLSGGMKASFINEISAEDLEKLEKEYNYQTQKLQEIKQKKSKLEKDIEIFQSQISKWEIEIPKIEMDIKALKERKSEIKVKIPQLKTQTKLNPDEEKKMKEIEEKLHIYEKELDKIKKVFLNKKF